MAIRNFLYFVQLRIAAAKEAAPLHQPYPIPEKKNQTEKKNNSFYHNLNLKTILNKNFNSNLYRKNRIKNNCY